MASVPERPHADRRTQNAARGRLRRAAGRAALGREVGSSAAARGARPGRSTATTPLSRRDLLRLAALAVPAAAAACRGSRPTPTTGGAKVRLVLQDWRGDWMTAVMGAMLTEFHAMQPSIRVVYAPDPDDVETSLLRELQAGTGPDVFSGCCTHMPIIAQEGHALDLAPYVAADLDRSVIDDWDPVQFAALRTRDGLQYAVPKYHGALALYYNMDAFDERGLPYPDSSWNYDDYLAAMRTLTGKPSSVGASHWGSMLDVSWERIQVHVNGWGGHLVDPADPARCAMADAPARSAMEWLRARMWDDRVMATALAVQNLSTREAFAQGRVAMVEDGSWALKDILDAAGFRLGIAPFPKGPQRRATLSTTDGYAISAATKHPEAAWELVKFLCGRDFGRALARANLMQPARASLVDDWVLYVRQEFPSKARDVDIAAFADGHLRGTSVTAEIFPNMAPAKELAYATWDRIFTLGQAPVDEIAATCGRIEAAQRGIDGDRG